MEIKMFFFVAKLIGYGKHTKNVMMVCCELIIYNLFKWLQYVHCTAFWHSGAKNWSKRLVAERDWRL